MLFCHRATNSSTPPPDKPVPQQTDPKEEEESWKIAPIRAAGSLDDLSVSSSLLPGAPDMPAALEAQLASLSSRETHHNYGTMEKRKSSTKRRQLSLLSSSTSLHSLLSSPTTGRGFQTVGKGADNSSSKTSAEALLTDLVDGNMSLPSTHKKNYANHYSGLSLLSLGHHRSSSNTLRKLRSLDVQQFSSLLDLEESFSDPWVGSIS